MKQIKNNLTIAFIILMLSNTFSVSAQSWSLAGNSGTTNSNFLGTTDNKKLSFRTNNQNRMTITGSGKIGIGTTSPASELHLVGTMQIDRTSIGGNTTPAMILNGLANNIVTVLKVDGIQKSSYGYDVSTNDFVIATDDVGLRPDFIINRTNGYTGLNNKTPSEQLHVVGKVRIDRDLTTPYFLQLNTTNVGNVLIQFTEGGIQKADMGFDHSTSTLRFSATSTGTRPDLCILSSNGNVGVGTSNPASKLHLTDGDFELTNSGENFYIRTNASGQLDFVPNSSVSAAAMTIDDGIGNNVGIGTSTPTNKLDVNGGAVFFGNIGVQTAANTRTIQCGSTQGALIGIGTAEYIQDAGTNALSTANDWLPATDNVWSLGTSANRWQDVWAVDGSINTSDQRDKTNIHDLNYGLNEIMKLRPVSFQWKSDQSYDKLGVIAQEIQQVLPEVVRDWDYQIDEKTGAKTKVPSTRLGVMYDDIIPVLIKGIQEQQAQIEELKSTVANLQLAISSLPNHSSESKSEIENAKSETGRAQLEQNIPNPASQTTTIRFSIPENTADAQLIITDVNGKTIQQFNHLTMGQSQVKVSTLNLLSGTYQYSLYLDGKKVDTKQMIISK